MIFPRVVVSEMIIFNSETIPIEMRNYSHCEDAFFSGIFFVRSTCDLP